MLAREQTNKINFTLTLVLSLILCVGGGWLTGLLTQTSVKSWYPTLIKSSLTPPDFTFPLVWTLLYAMMSLSLTLLIQSDNRKKSLSLFFFFLQLILNFSWSGAFFYLHNPALGLIVIILLWSVLGLTIQRLSDHSSWSRYLLLPYWLWVTYAGYLNFFIYLYN